MRKITLLLLLAVYAVQSYAQGARVDIVSIKEAVADTLYYNGLKNRFKNSGLSNMYELLTLYYGQAFQDDYAPYDTAWLNEISACLRMLDDRFSP